MSRAKSMPQELRDLATYPKYVLALQTIEGFKRAYWDEAKHHDRLADAYETIEKVHEHFFGVRKYASYESFKARMYQTHGKVKK